MSPRVSDGTKELHGTGRRDRLPRRDATVRLVKPPPPPKHLSAPAAAEWRALARVLVDTGVLTPADLRALELLAETLALERQMRDLVAIEGATIQTAEGGRKGHPALKLGAEARSQAMRLLDAFGLSPASRQKVDQAPTPPNEDSPWRLQLRALQGGQ